MKFKEHYYQTEIVNIPIHFNLIDLNELENGNIVFNITSDQVLDLVEKQVIQLKVGDKTFNNLTEACDYYDYLTERKANPEREHKQFILGDEFVWVDSKGKERSFETVATNAKIGSDTLILNMDTAKECAAMKLGFCGLGGACYALRKEKRTPQAMQAGIRQKEQWECLTPETYIKAIKKIKELDSTIKYVRFNEAGDFRDENDIKKFTQIATNVPELIFYTYTHRIDLKDQLKNLGDNIVLQGSGFMIDNAFVGLPLESYLETMDYIRKIRNMATGFMLKGEEIPAETKIEMTECVGDCSICNKCKIKKGWYIFLPIHGPYSAKTMKLRSIKAKIAKLPGFMKIINSNITDDQKADQIAKLLDIDSKEVISKIKLIPREVANFYKSVISDEKLRADFIDALMSYVPPVNKREIANKPSEDEMREIKQNSIKALLGKFKANIKQAQTRKKGTSEEHFKKMLDQLKDLIKAAKKSEIVKVKKASKKLAGQFGFATGRTKETDEDESEED